jgi:hypothetical protein
MVVKEGLGTKVPKRVTAAKMQWKERSKERGRRFGGLVLFEVKVGLTLTYLAGV